MKAKMILLCKWCGESTGEYDPEEPAAISRCKNSLCLHSTQATGAPPYLLPGEDHAKYVERLKNTLPPVTAAVADAEKSKDFPFKIQLEFVDKVGKR